MSHIISIDPGKQGFICVIQIDSIYPIDCIPIPVKKLKGKTSKTRVDTEKLSEILTILLSKYAIEEIVIEEQGVRSKQGLVSTGVIMEHFGWLKGFCAAKQIKYSIVPPKEWQTIYPEELRINKEPKERSKLYCSQLFPTLDLRKTSRSKKISDGKTDSILIGIYRIRKINADN